MRRKTLTLSLAGFVFAVGIAGLPGSASATKLDSSCVGGGPGATACTYSVGVSSCEVTCRDGYYACCGRNGVEAFCNCVGSSIGS